MKINTLFGLFIIFLVVGGYFFINASHYGTSSQTDITGYGEKHFTTQFFPILLAQTLYFSLAGAGIAFLIFFSKFKKFKLFWLIIVSSFLFIAYAMPTMSVHGRYVDVLVPLMIIGAFAYKEGDKQRLLQGFVLVLVSIPMFCLFWRDMVNTFSNVYLLIPYLQYLYVPYIFLVFLFLTTMSVKDRKKIATITFIFLLITFTAGNITNFQYITQASDNAYEHSLIGRYINENKLTDVVFDEDNYEDWWGTYCLLNYYNSGYIPMESTENITGNYFISSKTLPYSVLVTNEKFCQVEENSTELLYLYRIGKKC